MAAATGLLPSRSTNTENPMHAATRVLASLTLASFAGACIDRAGAHAELRAEPGVVQVTGMATLQVAPDVADVQMTLSIEEPTPRAATAALRSRQAKLLPALRTAGVAADELRVSQIALQPVYAPYGDGRIRGYEASVTVTASLRNFDRIADVMDAAAEVGVARMSTRFRSTELETRKKEVRGMALEAARDKAEQMAGAVSASLSRALLVTETPSGAGWLYGGVANVMETAQLAASDGPLLPDLQPLTLTVTVHYQLQ
jgi:uncharacterized protein